MTRFGQGDMLDVHTHSVPTEELQAVHRRIQVTGAPQVAVYANKSDRHLTDFIISRRVPGYPDPEDAGCTPVRIELPIRTATEVTLHKTSGRCDDHSADGRPLKMTTMSLLPDEIAKGWLDVGRTTGLSDCGLPAASAYIYVFSDPVYVH